MVANSIFFDCAESAIKTGSYTQDARLCHGFLSPEIGIGDALRIGDYQYAFAWIEDGDFVFYWDSNKRCVNLNRNVFYRTYQPTFVSMYPKDSALRMFRTMSNNGPWSYQLTRGKGDMSEDTVVTNKLKNKPKTESPFSSRDFLAARGGSNVKK